MAKSFHKLLIFGLFCLDFCSVFVFFVDQECHSQEECLGRILNAASKFSSESCASERKACGEKIDFEPASWL